MSLYKRKGIWYFDFVLYGRRYNGTTKRTNKDAARRVEKAEYDKALDRAQFGTKEEMTLGQAVDRYIAEVAARKGDARAQASRARKLFGTKMSPYDGRISKRFGLSRDLPLHELSARHVTELKAAREREGMAPNTIRLELALLQRVYNYARAEWEVRVRPDVRFVKPKPTSKMRFLRPDEEEALLKALEPTRAIPKNPPHETRGPDLRRMLQDQYDLVVVLLDTGARYTEAATLQWHSVNLKDGFVDLFRAKVRNEGIIAMTKRLREVLERRSTTVGGPYVFPGQDGKGPRKYATAGIKAAFLRAGINAPHLVERYGKATPHTFRDTFASKLAQRGHTLYEIQMLLGHSSPAMTQKYAHLVTKKVSVAAAATLDSYQKEVA